MTKVGVVKFSGSSVGGRTRADIQEGNVDKVSLVFVFVFVCFLLERRSLTCCCTRVKRGIERSFRCVRRVNGCTVGLEIKRVSSVGG